VTQGRIAQYITPVPLQLVDNGLIAIAIAIPAGAASFATWTDLSDWLYNYADRYFASTIDVTRTYFPNKLMMGQMSGLAGHHGCPRESVAKGLATHADVLTFSQVGQPLLDKLVAWGLGDKPIMDGWEGIGAQADSPGAVIQWNNIASDNVSSQSARGNLMAAVIKQALTGRGSGGTSYQTVGIKFWAYNDTDGGVNYGLVTPQDNAYDGHESVTGSVACSAPLQTYVCGGEASIYGDAISAVRNMLSSVWQIVK
jgi:hypothetical protein